MMRTVESNRLAWFSTTTWISMLLMLGGIALASISWWFFLLSAVGVFGPGILREIGWLRDKDEFQRQADYRAGYHAYITCGVLAFLLVAYFRASGETIQYPQELATLFMVGLCFTWFLSSLIGYWGAEKGAFRLLVSLGAMWLLFTFASNVGDEWTGWKALILHPLLTLPFFALAWLSTTHPRLSGVLLLGVSLCFAIFFGFFRQDHLAILNKAITFTLFIGPLIASGLALLGSRSEQGVDES